MRKFTEKFEDIVMEIERINALRESVVSKAFCALEVRHAALANLLLYTIGDRRKAERWMCLHQRCLAGRTAYEVLADGDEDTVWEEIIRMGQVRSYDSGEEPRIAY